MRMLINKTVITDFILLGFEELQGLQIFLFLVFLVIYILTMAAKFLTVLLIVTDEHLHTPMYFFLGNLSCLEIFYSSTILPRMLSTLLREDKTISLTGCMAQMYCFGFLPSTESYLLSVISYDRFLAVCKPLRYTVLINSRRCVQLAAGSWINGILFTSIYLALMLQLQYCSTIEIDHFFCESLSLIKISCSDSSLVTHAAVIMAVVFTFPPFVVTLMSYTYIIATILRIQSTTGKQKAFSTCSSHLIVVTIFYGAISIVYLIPNTKSTRNLNKMFSLLYTVLPPLINPLIYSLRNKDVKEVLRKAVGTFWKDK